MSYRDPYANGQYPQQYQDAPFDPYSVQHQHASRPYEQGGATYGEGGLGYADQDYAARPKEERSGFDNDDPVPAPLGEKTPGNVRRWRSEYQGNLWTKGSRASCFGRFFCCTIMMTLFFIISVVLSLALWLRPPNIIVGQPTPDLSTININGTSLSIALPVDISVNNPNYFTVELYTLDATVIYPINDTSVGSGHMSNIKFQDHTQTNFTFPVTIDYDSADDPTGAVITDLAMKCGLGGQSSSVSVTVNIKVGVKIMLIPITTTIQKPVSFACNLGSALTELQGLLNGLGININDLGSLAGLLT